jgi:hypothetical protein
VESFVTALDAGAFDLAKRLLEAYLARIAFVGDPPADVQQKLLAKLALAYGRLPLEGKRRFTAMFVSVPTAWITQPFASKA